MCHFLFRHIRSFGQSLCRCGCCCCWFLLFFFDGAFFFDFSLRSSNAVIPQCIDSIYERVHWFALTSSTYNVLQTHTTILFRCFVVLYHSYYSIIIILQVFAEFLIELNCKVDSTQIQYEICKKNRKINWNPSSSLIWMIFGANIQMLSSRCLLFIIQQR